MVLPHKMAIVLQPQICDVISVYVYVHQYDVDPIQGQDQGHWAYEVLKIALFQVYLIHHFGMGLKTDG